MTRKYFVGCEAQIQGETKIMIIWLRAKREKARGPFPRACFDNFDQAQAEANKRTAQAKSINWPYVYHVYDAHSMTPVRAPFDQN